MNCNICSCIQFISFIIDFDFSKNFPTVHISTSYDVMCFSFLIDEGNGCELGRICIYSLKKFNYPFFILLNAFNNTPYRIIKIPSLDEDDFYRYHGVIRYH